MMLLMIREPVLMKLKAFILAIQRREKTDLAATLARWRLTDWGEEPTIQMQPVDWPISSMADRWSATSKNSLELLKKGYESQADFILFTEDDVEPNLNLRHNLNNWFPMVCGELKAGSLYTPNVIIDPFKPDLTETELDLHNTARVSHKLSYRLHRPNMTGNPTKCMWGSQAYVFSHEFCGVLIEKWNKVGGGQDSRVIQITNKLGVPIYYHLPDLFEHHGDVTHNRFTVLQHKSADFDRQFRAPNRSLFRFPANLPGRLSMMEAELLWRMAFTHRVLELGAGSGKSTAVLLQGAKMVTVVDNFQKCPVGDFNLNIKPYGEPFVVRTENWCADRPDLGGTGYGMIVLDGRKDFKAVRDDIEFAMPLFSQAGGFIGIHDYGVPDHPEVKLAVDAAAYRYCWERLERQESLIFFRVPAYKHYEETVISHD
jgi:hypothetical protein